MARFADHFGLGLTQYQLDFVNVPLHTDIKLFVDPTPLALPPTHGRSNAMDWSSATLNWSCR